MRTQDPVTTTPPPSKQGAGRSSTGSPHSVNSVVEDYGVSLLGSSGSGKTTLIRRCDSHACFLSGEPEMPRSLESNNTRFPPQISPFPFPRRLVYRVMEDEYTPTVEERYVAQLVVDGQPVRLRVLDQRGKPPSHTNPLATRSALDSDPLDAQGIILAFSLKNRETYAYAQRVAASIDIARYGYALVLVGTHSDCAPGERQVSAAEAAALASSLGIAYIETSAMTHSCTYAFYLLARKLRQNAEPSSLLRQIHTLRMLYSSPSSPAVESSSLTSALSRSSSFSQGTISSTQFGKMRSQDQPVTFKNGDQQTPPQSPPSSAKRLSLIEQARADRSTQRSAKSPWRLRFKWLSRLYT